MDGWEPIATVPRDGTPVWLTWFDGDTPQDVVLMAWEPETGNPLVQAEDGIWVARHRLDKTVICTWSEADPAGAPTHWRRVEWLH